MSSDQCFLRSQQRENIVAKTKVPVCVHTQHFVSEAEPVHSRSCFYLSIYLNDGSFELQGKQELREYIRTCDETYFKKSSFTHTKNHPALRCPEMPSLYIIIHQTHYEKSDWSRAINQFTIACELNICCRYYIISCQVQHLPGY